LVCQQYDEDNNGEIKEEEKQMTHTEVGLTVEAAA
jgi:hypothetical protein